MTAVRDSGSDGAEHESRHPVMHIINTIAAKAAEQLALEQSIRLYLFPQHLLVVLGVATAINFIRALASLARNYFEIVAREDRRTESLVPGRRGNLRRPRIDAIEGAGEGAESEFPVSLNAFECVTEPPAHMVSMGYVCCII